MEYMVLEKKHKCRNELDTEDLYFERGTCNGHEIFITESRHDVLTQVMFDGGQWVQSYAPGSWDRAKREAIETARRNK